MLPWKASSYKWNRRPMNEGTEIGEGCQPPPQKAACSEYRQNGVARQSSMARIGAFIRLKKVTKTFGLYADKRIKDFVALKPNLTVRKDKVMATEGTERTEDWFDRFVGLMANLMSLLK